MKRLFVALFLLFSLAAPAPAQTRNIFLSAEEIAKLPVTGKAWDAMKKEADAPPTTPNLSNQDEPENSRTLARALIFVRTGNSAYRDRVITTLRQVPGTETGGRTLALGRKLGAYIIAADLLGYRENNWVSFVTVVANETLDGSNLLKKCEDKANNWSASCIWSRAARAAYLGDLADLDRTAAVFRGMCALHGQFQGPRGNTISGFTFPSSAFGELGWQPDPAHPEVICPAESAIAGHSMSGALPEELRRATSVFRWAPPCENYCWSALEGYIGTAWLLARAGYGGFDINRKAILRAVEFQYKKASCPAVGDDTHQPHVIAAIYGTFSDSSLIPVVTPSTHGKLFGFGDWWASRVLTPPPPPPPVDFIAEFEFHFDAGTNRWTAHRLNDGETASGTGPTTADALRDWLSRNSGEP